MGSFGEGSLFCRVFRWITDFMYRKADLITTVSPGKVKSLGEKLHGDVRHKVMLVSNGYDLRNDREVRDETAVERFGLKERFTCVYIGNVGLAQGLESLLEIAANTKYGDIQFLIFGGGAEKEILEAKAKERGLEQVRFCGKLPHEQVASVLTQAKISYIPLKSAKMKDSVPTKLYESLAMGCPVLLAAVGDAADILAETGLGLSVSPDHMEEIVAKFDEMVAGYESFLGHRDGAMELIRQKHSRQSAVLELEKELRILCGEAKERVNV
jgi:glycosyltransferase involved in cell wall biosynthesis